MSGLLALAERCEQATGFDDTLDALIWNAIGQPETKAWTGEPAILAYTASLDAAMTVVPVDHDWLVRSDGSFANVSRKDATHITTVRAFGEERDEAEFAAESFRQGHRYAEAATPALALCAAALRAHAASEAGDAR